MLADNALTTPKELREELGIGSETRPSLVVRCINTASNMIENYCDTTFGYEAARVEKQAGYGRPLMVLGKAPVLSVASVTYDGQTIQSSDYEIQDAEAGLLRNVSGAWCWTAAIQSGITYTPAPGTERKLYEVTYSCGYVTPAKAADLGLDRTLPYDLEDACILLAAMRYHTAGRDPTLAAVKLLSHSESYRNSAHSSSMPPRVVEILDKYKR
jgi:hypothetical protein